MLSNKKLINVVGWTVFTIAAIVYFFSAERTGSLWDCGEFILGAYKLQVVHPPGAPLFMIVGRLFAFMGEIFSSKLSDIAFAVNMMSGICTAFVAMFVAWITMIFGRLAMVGREGELEGGSVISNALAGLAAGLSTAFATSIWFSAVEGEVYAMSTFFTALTFWSAMKWYALPDSQKSDRWLLFTLYAVGLSTGVHLLSILTLPAVALLYYFKKYEKHSIGGGILAIGAGMIGIGVIQKLIVVGIPTLWKNFEIFAVNGIGLPFHSGLVITLGLLGALVYLGLRYAHSKGKYLLQMILVALTLVTIGFSTIGVIVIRANADTPVNMNVPSDAVRILPYINREQYGERALVYGPHFAAGPVAMDREKRYGRVGDKYEYTDEKYSYEYNAKDKMLFPRIGHADRSAQHRQWMDGDTGVPGMAYNLKFLFKYQIGWMYGRYFMWNFAGRQNGKQGYAPWDKSSGHWVTGIGFVDDAKLDYDTSELPESLQSLANNNYYMLPFIFGLIGLFFHARKRPKDFMALMMLFLITGIGIIIYSNQPPNEPRERDYVLVGSIFSYCIWIGMAVNAIYMGFEKYKFKGIPAAGVAGALVLVAPFLMGTQNFDDLGRKDHYASRDYASNFLNSVDENAIIFTYGDNDTYPLWYAQEVEEIRTDVRVVNLSLIAVDWYINKLRSKVNDSPAIKLTISEDAYRGASRNQSFFYPTGNKTPTNLISALKLIGSDVRPPNVRPELDAKGYVPSQSLRIPTNRQAVEQLGMRIPGDNTTIAPEIPINFATSKTSLSKDQYAILDVIASNIWERPIYFAVTCKNDKLMGINNYTQLEGLALRVVPFNTAADKQIPGIYGSGRVAANKLYDNVMNKWKWGNFDKKKLFVDNSYGAELQAMQMAMLRGAKAFMGTDNAKAVALADKYFEGFPNMNFPYDDQIFPFIQIYYQSGQLEKAKIHMRILAEVSAERLNFFDSMSEETRNSSFQREYVFAMRAANNILNNVGNLGDVAFATEMNNLLGTWSMSGIRD